MQFYQLFLIILVINRFSSCQNGAVTPLQNALTCIQSLTNPCNASDADCVDSFQTYNSCSSQCMADSGSVSSLRGCIGGCKVTSTKINEYSVQVDNCINLAISTIINFKFICIILLVFSL